jgi:hypothetical protein
MSCTEVNAQGGLVHGQGAGVRTDDSTGQVRIAECVWLPWLAYSVA